MAASSSGTIAVHRCVPRGGYMAAAAPAEIGRRRPGMPPPVWTDLLFLLPSAAAAIVIPTPAGNRVWLDGDALRRLARTAAAGPDP